MAGLASKGLAKDERGRGNRGKRLIPAGRERERAARCLTSASTAARVREPGHHQEISFIWRRTMGQADWQFLSK